MTAIGRFFKSLDTVRGTPGLEPYFNGWLIRCGSGWNKCPLAAAGKLAGLENSFTTNSFAAESLVYLGIGSNHIAQIVHAADDSCIQSPRVAAVRRILLRRLGLQEKPQ